MIENERRDWLLVLDKLKVALADTERLLIDYPPDANDSDFNFLVTKATKFREWKAEIERMLREDKPLEP